MNPIALMTRSRARQLVEAGAVFLDCIAPAWLTQIPETFDIRFECDCNIAHLYGSYSEGRRLLGLTNGSAADLGLFVLGRQTNPGVIAMYGLLNEEWRKIRAERIASTSKQTGKEVIDPVSYATAA